MEHDGNTGDFRDQNQVLLYPYPYMVVIVEGSLLTPLGQLVDVRCHDIGQYGRSQPCCHVGALGERWRPVLLVPSVPSVPPVAALASTLMTLD